MVLSVVIPTLNEADRLAAALDSAPETAAVIVVDGGSDDGTLALARTHPRRPRLLATARGRGRQQNAGAALAGPDCDTLLFLHADSLLPPGADAQVARALADPQVVGGNFAIHFEPESAFHRLAGAFYNRRARRGRFYGDSGLFVRRAVWERLGGFREAELMEDIEFVARLRREGRLVCLPGPVVTSGRRFAGKRRLPALAQFLCFELAYSAGVPAERLARWYRAIR